MGNMIGGITGKGFQPGQTGNPHGFSTVGRKFQAEVRARSHDGKLMLDYLFAQMLDTKAHEMIRFKCAELLVQYGLGKPREQDDAEGMTFDASRLNDTERDQLIGLLSKLGLQGERPSAHPEAPPASVAAS